MSTKVLSRKRLGGELLGVSEVAKLLKVTPAAVSNWQVRDKGFPEPIITLRCGPIFLKTEVAAWHKNYCKVAAV